MKKGLYYIIILIFFVASGCKKKEYPVPVNSTEPVFYSKLLINGSPFEISAGTNNYYMFSSYTMDSSGVYNLIGEFRQTGCDTCISSKRVRLRFQINDSRISSPGADINIGSALQTRSYNFLLGDHELGYYVDFTGIANRAGATYLWDFGDGSTSTETNPGHMFGSGVYHVSLTTKNTDGSQSTVINTLSFYAPGDLNVYISATPSASNTVGFAPNVSGGTAPYTYSWDFGDRSALVSGSNVSHTFGLTGGYNVKLTVTDALGKTAVCYYNAVAGIDLSAYAANFSFSIAPGTSRRLGLSKTSIQFTDASGTTYTSDNALQPANSSFQIISVEDFVNNENNQPVKKVKLKFNCTVFNGAQSVSLQGTDVTVGFAYK